MRIKRLKQALVLIVVSIPFIVFAVPYYLTYSDLPHKADAVVVLVGPGYEARLKEARRLIHEGYGDYLAIPAHCEVTGPFHAPASFNPRLPHSSFRHTSSGMDTLKQSKSSQNTYKELLLAKDMIDRYGWRSAVIVSSPYHMRRIKIMAMRIFSKDTYRIYCVGSSYEDTHMPFWFFHRYDRDWILSEYMKIIFFVIRY